MIKIIQLNFAYSEWFSTRDFMNITALPAVTIAKEL